MAVQSIRHTRRDEAAIVRAGIRHMALNLLPIEIQEDPAWRLIGLVDEDAQIPGDFSARHDDY